MDRKSLVEQAVQVASDNAVHRIELLGDRILYDAAFPLIDGNFDYCLAGAGPDTTLTPTSRINETIQESARRIARLGHLELGSVEYLLDVTGEPVFIDFNPVSSLHPNANDVLGSDPVDTIADYLISRSNAIEH